MSQHPSSVDGERLSHVDERGEARMVDVGGKPETERVARAGARVWMAARTMELLQHQALPKGDVLAVARVAGILAAKRTHELIPLCHPLPLTHLAVDFKVVPEESRVDIECTARTDSRTGVEMEAITGAAVAAITIYDMCKAVDRGMIIGDIRLLEKRGGKEDYVRDESQQPSATRAPEANQPADQALAGPGDDGEVPRLGKVLSVNVSPGKGERKKPMPSVHLREEHGIEGDGHAGPWHRQVSLLAQESIDTMVAKGLDVKAGDFAENITTTGLVLTALPVGTQLEIGPTLTEVTQIGKVCHDRCAIYYMAGDCVMPREGIFVRVLRGGDVTPGDEIRVTRLAEEPSGTPIGEITA